jgi:ABC-type uncharacterized transport system substrate-binding protein
MTVPLPDSVQDALNKLSNELAKHGLKLHSVDIQRQKFAPQHQTYLLDTPGGVVHIKQEL